MILEVTNESIKIVHLCKSRWFKVRGKIETINFPDKITSLFDFRSGVFVSCEHFPLNETLATERKNRLLYMINPFYGYSLTSRSPNKHNCESFVYKIKNGAYQQNEVCEFISNYGKLSKGIIMFIDSVCSISS